MSNLVYFKHDSKREDLYKCLYVENNKNVTTMEHYCRLASKPVLANSQDQSAWAAHKIAYFYISTSSQRACRDRKVNILHQDNYLHELNGWNILRQHFESTKDNN